MYANLTQGTARRDFTTVDLQALASESRDKSVEDAGRPKSSMVAPIWAGNFAQPKVVPADFATQPSSGFLIPFAKHLEELRISITTSRDNYPTVLDSVMSDWSSSLGSAKRFALSSASGGTSKHRFVGSSADGLRSNSTDSSIRDEVFTNLDPSESTIDLDMLHRSH